MMFAGLHSPQRLDKYHIQVGRTHLLVTKTLVSDWLLSGGFPKVLEPTPVLCHMPSPFGNLGRAVSFPQARKKASIS